MRYLENSFKFLSKHFAIFIPFFLMPVVIIALSITRVMAAIGELGGLEFFRSYNSYLIARQPERILALISPIFSIIGFIFAISIVLYVIVYPATFGMINKAYSTGSASLADFLPELKKNFIKFILYILALILFSIAFVIGFGIVFAIIGAVLGLFGGLGDLLIRLISLAVNILFIPMGVLVLMWFAAMVTEDCGPFEAFPKAFSATLQRFWSILGITLLLAVGTAILGGILVFIFALMKSFVIAGIFYFVLMMIYSVLMMIYSFEVYRGETYKNDLLAVDMNDSMPHNPGDYL